jgi:hypothetical protein
MLHASCRPGTHRLYDVQQSNLPPRGSIFRTSLGFLDVLPAIARALLAFTEADRHIRPSAKGSLKKRNEVLRAQLQ